MSGRYTEVGAGSGVSYTGASWMHNISLSENVGWIADITHPISDKNFK